MLGLVLLCLAALLLLAIAGIATARRRIGTPLVYGGCLGVTALALLAALVSLAAAPSTLTLPLGLPWIGMHFRRAGGVLPRRRQ